MEKRTLLQMNEKELCEAISFAKFIEKETGVKLLDSLPTVVLNQGNNRNKKKEDQFLTVEVTVNFGPVLVTFYKWLKNNPKGKNGRIGIDVIYANPVKFSVRKAFRRWNDCRDPEEFRSLWEDAKKGMAELIAKIGR
jgi:hypothetical protein